MEVNFVAVCAILVHLLYLCLFLLMIVRVVRCIYTFLERWTNKIFDYMDVVSTFGDRGNAQDRACPLCCLFEYRLSVLLQRALCLLQGLNCR
jgi:hypothetical protein